MIFLPQRIQNLLLKVNYKNSRKNIPQHLQDPSEKTLIENLRRNMDGRTTSFEIIKIFLARQTKSTKESKKYRPTKETSISISDLMKLPKAHQNIPNISIMNQNPNKIYLINIQSDQAQFLLNKQSHIKKRTRVLEDQEYPAIQTESDLCIQSQPSRKPLKVILMDFPSNSILQKYPTKKIISLVTVPVRLKVSGKQKWKFRVELTVESKRERKKDKKNLKQTTT